MLRARRYRAYPTVEQEGYARQFIGAGRAVYNLALEQRKTQYELSRKRSLETRETVTYTKQTKQLKVLRDDPEIAPWLKDAPSQCLQQKLQDLDTAFQRFFKGQGAYPKFKRKYGSAKSFRVPQHVELRKVNKWFAEVKLTKLGWVRVRYHRQMIGEIQSATMILEPDGNWYISILCKTNESGKGAKVRRRRQRARLNNPDLPGVGIDVGVRDRKS